MIAIVSIHYHSARGPDPLLRREVGGAAGGSGLRRDRPL